MPKYIKKKDLKRAIDDCTWYHINKNGELVEGANPADHEPLYKYSDIKRIIKGLPTRKFEDEPQIYCNTCGLNKKCGVAFTKEARRCQNESRLLKTEPNSKVSETPTSSETPNNCEHITEDGVTCARYPACDDCPDNPLNKVKGSERLVKGSEQTDCQTCKWWSSYGYCVHRECKGYESQTERSER